MKLCLTPLLVVLATSSPARADETFAAASFRQAEELAKQNKWADACPLYEASYKADPQLGVLLHLADCNEHLGRLATAYSEFTDATELAHGRSDAKREALARKRADALAPKVSKLHLNPPRQPIPGLVVDRDGTDITVLVGTDIPTDPGDHEIVASAPGRVGWKTKILIGAQAIATVDIPVLDKEPEKPVGTPPPVVHTGKVKITTVPNGEILLDSKRVGTGTYEQEVKSGGHTLRIVAAGKRPYQAEILVADGEARTIDVPLEDEAAAVVVAPRVVARSSHGWWDGVRVFAGMGFDGLVSDPGTNGMCTTSYCGHGPRGLPGGVLAARGRLPLVGGNVSFDPGVAFHLRRIYTEHCSPCMQTDDVWLDDLEAFALLRVGTGRRAKLGLLVGPYLAVRVHAANKFSVMLTPYPTDHVHTFDPGVMAALELFVGRFGGQLQFQYGAKPVSDVLDSNMIGFAVMFGLRI